MGNRADLHTARWRRLRRHILDRDGWECQVCGKLLGMAQVDHRVPVLKGGALWDESNLQTICFFCHVAKTKIDKGLLPDPEREAWAEYLAR